MNWEEWRQGEWRCVDSSGRVVARITRTQGEYLVSGDILCGVYVSLETMNVRT
jgi:hypothetical protein